ncbi:Ubiquitin-conjugating_enzyme E2 [Hexamita inflata]|uniref:Ubiquitin-conjugating enzyme E2 n=1 Tax=Hexamita inflata TaxID=28002 RepID=A0AA86UW44_9EUKA|nr:Ubiquitin-conjugating enzyme E2 [Hexamita inflata]CAI9925876.1 Ubiquitin-conjugating enzyme E2 [Hexamita inflata]CAI9934911.1 Ubiquitin-conjugating enzyme E2 [Hexamita inflata]CAI9968887.1 Ubiquitin-conjugating enzyme E2 [Hexamita inflata]CAI9974155.1 Ubiquitin-conjugating enzyme E2 [Hexamita inflata]
MEATSKQICDRRLAAERKIFLSNTLSSIYAVPKDPDNLYEWFAVILGPEQTPWQGGVFILSIKFPPEYPFKQPNVLFETHVFHPNVYTDGRICLDLLQGAWKPIFTMDTILLSIRSLLSDPNPASPANQDAAKLYEEDRHGYEMKVRECVLDSLGWILPIELKGAVD